MPRNALAAPGVFEPDPGNALAPPPSLADAWDVTAPALRRNAADTWAAAKDPQFWQDAVEQYRNALLMGSVAPTMKGLGLDAAATKVLRDMMPETLQSRSFYSIKPPEMPPRPFADDYKGEVLSDGSGTLTHTVDGQPITARHVVGRRTAGKPDTAITPEGVDDISENVLGAVPQAVAKREMGGDAGRYIHGVDPLTCSRP